MAFCDLAQGFDKLLDGVEPVPAERAWHERLREGRQAAGGKAANPPRRAVNQLSYQFGRQAVEELAAAREMIEPALEQIVRDTLDRGPEGEPCFHPLDEHGRELPVALRFVDSEIAVRVLYVRQKVVERLMPQCELRLLLLQLFRPNEWREGARAFSPASARRGSKLRPPMRVGEGRPQRREFRERTSPVRTRRRSETRGAGIGRKCPSGRGQVAEFVSPYPTTGDSPMWACRLFNP